MWKILYILPINIVVLDDYTHCTLVSKLTSLWKIAVSEMEEKRQVSPKNCCPSTKKKTSHPKRKHSAY